MKVNLWGRPKSPFNTRAYPPGQHGQTKNAKLSDYGVQLQAKQKLKSYYGNMNEKQFRNTYKKAIMKKGDTAENLIGLLERRLDAVIYRSKFSNTIFSSRQLINHGHVKVNGKKVNISSYQVKEEDNIEIRVFGKSFLHNQVRIIIGTLVNVGIGKWDDEKVLEILKSKDRTKAGPTAPSCGLYLEKVTY